VTRYYQKFLYSKPHEQKQVRAEIVALNRDQSLKDRFVERDAESDSGMGQAQKTADESRAFYIPNFEPKTTTTQKFGEVELLDFQLTSVEGEKVNALVLDGEYIFSFKVRFGESKQNVGFSIAFQNQKGLPLAGMAVPTNRKEIIKEVNRGEVYLIRLRFRCVFLPGNHYITVSVHHLDEDGDKKPLLRIKDIMVFKVQDEKGLSYWGKVKVGQEPEVIKISK
jgi:hypothetical protein